MSQSLQQVKESPEVSFIPLGEQEAIKLSLGIIERQIVSPTKSGKKPTQKEMMDFLMLCRSRKLNPFTGDAWLVGYDSRDGANFSIITSHESLLKRAELCQHYDGMESGLILEGENGDLIETEGDFLQTGKTAIGAWARVHRSDRKIPTYRRLNISRYDTGKSYWAKNRELMAVKCAEADALRSAFPTSTGGLYIREEMGKESSIQVENTQPTALLSDADDDHDLGPSKPENKFRTSRGKHDDQALESLPADKEGELLA